MVNKQEARTFLHSISNDALDIVFQTTAHVSTKELIALVIWIFTELMHNEGGLDD